MDIAKEFFKNMWNNVTVIAMKLELIEWFPNALKSD